MRSGTSAWTKRAEWLTRQFASRISNVAGIGIGGDERRAGPEQFREVYDHAAQYGLRLTVHAGETVGAESIWGALRELKADRIGHGLHAIDDPELVRYLAEKQIPVEVCITSNVMTGCCTAVEQHPVRKLFDAGVQVTLNTDDPDMFHTNLLREYQIAHRSSASAKRSCASWRKTRSVRRFCRRKTSDSIWRDCENCWLGSGVGFHHPARLRVVKMARGCQLSAVGHRRTAKHQLKGKRTSRRRRRR